MIYFDLLELYIEHDIYKIASIEDAFYVRDTVEEYRAENELTVSVIVYHAKSQSYITRVFLKIDDAYFFKCAVKSCFTLSAAKSYLEQINRNLPALMMGMPEEEMR